MSQLAASDWGLGLAMSGQVGSGYDPGRRLLSRGEVAKCLGASVSTVVRLERRGDLPHVKLGRLVRFRQVDLEALIDRAYGGNAVNDTTPLAGGGVSKTRPMAAAERARA
jgi:excisionase family DNA binding protein